MLISRFSGFRRVFPELRRINLHLSGKPLIYHLKNTQTRFSSGNRKSDADLNIAKEDNHDIFKDFDETLKSDKFATHDDLMREFFKVLKTSQSSQTSKDQISNGSGNSEPSDTANDEATDKKGEILSKIFEIGEEIESSKQYEIETWSNDTESSELNLNRLSGQKLVVYRMLRSQNLSDVYLSIIHVFQHLNLIPLEDSSENKLDENIKNQLNEEAFPKWLAATVRMCNRFNDPYMAHLVLNEVKKFPLEKRIMWLDSFVYKEIIDMEWACFGDLLRIGSCIHEMSIDGVIINNAIWSSLWKIKSDIQGNLEENSAIRYEWKELLAKLAPLVADEQKLLKLHLY